MLTTLYRKEALKFFSSPVKDAAASLNFEVWHGNLLSFPFYTPLFLLICTHAAASLNPEVWHGNLLSFPFDLLLCFYVSVHKRISNSLQLLQLLFVLTSAVKC